MAAAAAPGACSMSCGTSVAASVLGVARALEQNPELARACVARGHESSRTAIAGSTTARCLRTSSATTSAAPSLFWSKSRRAAGRLDDRAARPEHAAVARRGGRISYDRDSLADELLIGCKSTTSPTWSFRIPTKPMTTASTRTAASRPGRIFRVHARRLDLLYREGQKGSPKLLSIGLHDRLIGRPGRCAGLSDCSSTCAASKPSGFRAASTSPNTGIVILQ